MNQKTCTAKHKNREKFSLPCEFSSSTPQSLLTSCSHFYCLFKKPTCSSLMMTTNMKRKFFLLLQNHIVFNCNSMDNALSLLFNSKQVDYFKPSQGNNSCLFSICVEALSICGGEKAHFPSLCFDSTYLHSVFNNCTFQII